MKIQEEKIQTFWKWFIENEALIKSSIENESSTEQAHVVDQMNNFILDIGMLTWDLGLDDSNAWFLTLSPNGDKELLEISQRIIEHAPTHLDWAFHSSRQALVWERTFTVYNENMDEVEIDASSWHYIAQEESNRKIKLIFEAKNIQHLDEETAETAVNLFLVHEIGEKTKIVRVSSISIVHELESGYQEIKSSVNELKNHFS